MARLAEQLTSSHAAVAGQHVHACRAAVASARDALAAARQSLSAPSSTSKVPVATGTGRDRAAQPQAASPPEEAHAKDRLAGLPPLSSDYRGTSLMRHTSPP